MTKQEIRVCRNPQKHRAGGVWTMLIFMLSDFSIMTKNGVGPGGLFNRKVFLCEGSMQTKKTINRK